MIKALCSWLATSCLSPLAVAIVPPTVPMGMFRFWAVAPLTLLLAACGGGGGDTPQVTAATPPAQAASASLDAKGGSVKAQLAGGAQVTLSVPADALAASTTFTLTPTTAPAGSLGAFTLAPSGVTLAKAVTLSVQLPSGSSVNADTVLLLDTGHGQMPLSRSIDVATRTVSVDLASLDALAAAGGAAVAGGTATAQHVHAAATTTPPPGTLVFDLAALNVAGRIGLLDQLTAALSANGSKINATNEQIAMNSLIGDPAADGNPSVRADIATWRSVVCSQQTFAISAYDSFNGTDVPTFSQKVSDVLDWTRFAQDLNTTLTLLINPPAETGCPNLAADPSVLIAAHLTDYLANDRAILAALDPRVEFDQLLSQRIPELVNLEAILQGTNLPGSVLTLVSEQTQRLRAAAYTSCRAARDQSQQQKLLVAVVTSPQFQGAAPYGEIDLFQDIQFCGMPLRYQVVDANGIVMQQGDAGGLGVGQVATDVVLHVAGASRLILSGPLAALICPTGSQNNEQLVFGAGAALTSIAPVTSLTPSNANGYLESSFLPLDLAALLGNGARFITVGRIGEFCNGNFPNLSAHSPIARFSLDTTSLTIVTSALPSSPVFKPVSIALAASGGTAPLTWSATGLPDGLALNASTGLISGTPTLPSSVNVQITVTDSAGLTASSTLPLTISPLALAGTWTIVVSNVSDPPQACAVSTTSFTYTAAQSAINPNRMTLGGFVVEVGPSGAMNFLGVAGSSSDPDTFGSLGFFGFQNFNGTLNGKTADWTYDQVGGRNVPACGGLVDLLHTTTHAVKQ
jgi:hypothetical protein